ncbi:MAG TPA: OB-fold nucleic acid binding domain-containing protein, partial [Polyangia bacterium]
MQSSLEYLRKLFRLEHANHYNNTAVIGGLANILSYWEGDARNEHIPEPLIQAVAATLNGYTAQTPEVRIESLKALWRRIQEVYPEAIPARRPVPPPASQPVPEPIVQQQPPEPPMAVAEPITQSLPAEPPSAPLETLPADAPPEPELPAALLPVPPEAPPPQPPEPQPPILANATPSKDPAETQPVTVPFSSPQPVAPRPAAPTPAMQPVHTQPRPMPGRADSRPGGVTSKRPIALNASLTVLAGVGPKHAVMLSRLSLNTLGDMLYNFPRRYDDYSQLKPIRDVFYGQQITVIGEVTMISSRPLRGGKMTITEVVINDGTAGLRLSWFNQPWVANRMKVGDAISVSGKVEQYLGRLVMNSPDWEPVEVENLHTNRIVPVYPLTANVNQQWMRRLMHTVVTYWAPKLTDHLPEKVRQAASLPDLGTALLQAHFPDSDEKLQAARQRLAFDEIFFLQTGVLRQRRDWQSAPGRIFSVEDAWLEARLAALPFALTTAQKKAIEEIRTDLKSGKPMNRLLQGDVGSGKTVVAALTAAMVNQAGAQAAILAPTAIL